MVLVPLLVALVVIRGERIYLVQTPVEAVAVGQGAIHSEITGPGTLDALLNTNLGAKVNSRVARMYADVGDRVRTGQVLMLLDQDEASAQHEESQAACLAARDQLLSATESQKRSEMIFLKAERDRQREENLYRQGIVSLADLDTVQTTARSAAQDNAQAKAMLAQAQSALTQAEGANRETGSRFRDTRLMAPFDAVVTARFKSPGDIVNPGMPILSLTNVPSIIVVARFDETLLGRIAQGASARVQFYSDFHRSFAGKVARINPSVDPDSREFTVNISLDLLPDNWAMGERANVTIMGQSLVSSQSIPVSYLTERGGQRGVWVLRGSRAAFVPVTPGVMDSLHMEVVTSLPAGTKVLNPKGVRQGMRVKPVEAGT